MWPLLLLLDTDITTSTFSIPSYFLNLLLFIFVYSRFIFCFAFFLLAHRLLSDSDKFDFNQSKIISRFKKIDLKNKYGSFIFVVMSLLTLFNLFQLFLSIICAQLFPFSPFLNVLSSLKLIEFNPQRGEKPFSEIQTINDINNYTLTNKAILLCTATISMISLLIFVIGIYNEIFRKFLLKSVLKNRITIIFSAFLLNFFGLPLMITTINILSGTSVDFYSPTYSRGYG